MTQRVKLKHLVRIGDGAYIPVHVYCDLDAPLSEVERLAEQALNNFIKEILHEQQQHLPTQHDRRRRRSSP